MNNSRGKILWVDDEIDHLKPHILFLEDKGFSISTATNGADAVTMVKENNFQLILMDQFMPGQDGIQTIQEFTELRPNLPVIMITKSEEEWLMDEAISQKISQFLIKPVSPSQIFMACKNIFDSSQIITDKVSKEYLESFKNLDSKISDVSKIEDWYDIYNILTDWSIQFDLIDNPGLYDIFKDQYKDANHIFCNYIQNHYLSWMQSNFKDRPLFSNDVIKNFMGPKIKKNKK